MKKCIILFSVLGVFLYSCTKKIECDNAQICVKNLSTDTVYYCWGCNTPNEILLPNNKTCIDLGPVDVKKDEFLVYAEFRSTKGNFTIESTECYTEKEIY